MKKFTYLAFLSLLAFASCKKTTVDLDENNNNPSGSTAYDDFNWMGEAPLSLKNNGEYHHNTQVVGVSASGFQIITSIDESSTGYNLTFPSDATPGTTYSLAMGGETAVNYFKVVDGQNADVFKSSNGKIRVIQNDGQYVSGFFYATVRKDNPDGTFETRTITEGYFKVKNR
jgi:hypothetical protein